VYIIHPGALPPTVYDTVFARIMPPEIGISVLDLSMVPEYWGALAGASSDGSIETLAASLWREVQNRQGILPTRFVIMGWSFGGIIGFEVARQAKDWPGFCGLMLLDSIAPIPKYQKEADALDRKMLMRWFVMYLSARKGKAIDVSLPSGRCTEDQMLELVLARAIEAGALMPETPVEGIRKLHQAFLDGLLRNNKFAIAYRAEPLDVNAVLVKATTSLIPMDRHLGWKSLLGRGSRRIVCAGDHYSMLTDPKANQSLVDALLPLLRGTSVQDGWIARTLRKLRSAPGPSTDEWVKTSRPAANEVGEATAKREVLIELNGVRRRYDLGGTTVEALRGVSLRIHKGEFVAVWGPSGSGKSTLMNILGLVDAPTDGEMVLGGTPIGRLSDNQLTDLRSRKIGFVFQNFNLIPVLTALENVTVPLQIQGVGAAQAQARAAQALKEVGLEKHLHSRPDKMSGGQRQRVAIARALVTEPSLVIADEPTANLDSENSYMVVELMRELNRSKHVTFIFTTHDQRLLDLVDRKILLKDGQLHKDEKVP